MVNGVLVERTVKDVLPTLKTNSEGLQQVLEDMLKQYKTKQAELDTWKVSAFKLHRQFQVAAVAPGYPLHRVGYSILIHIFLLHRRRTTSKWCSLK